MATRPAVIHIRPWEWRTDNADPVPGLMLNGGSGRGTFVPYTEAHNLADQIIDYTEQHEEQQQ